MQNAQLVGLSRQVALQRELDVVANNIANLNTNGFKADGVVFQEMLMPGVSANQFPAPDRRISYVHDRATWLDMSAGYFQTTGGQLDVAINGQGFLAVKTGVPMEVLDGIPTGTTDLFLGDDAYHGGAFMLSANFGFYAFFRPQTEPAPPKPAAGRVGR